MMLLVPFSLSARGGGAAPGRPGMLIFDQPAESAGTSASVTGLLAGRQGRGLDMPPDDGRERAQHAAEAAQRQAEEALKDQIDAVAKAEDGVNAGTSSPVLSDTQVAQRDLEHAQAEREAKEQEIRDAEEKARLEAEAEAAAKKASRAGDSPTVGKTGLSNSTPAADTARARAEHAARTSAPAASAAVKASSPAGQAWTFFQAVGFTLYAVVGNALHAAQEVASDPAWTLGLPLWAIGLIGLSSIALCLCCVHLCGRENDKVAKARRRTSLYASMGLPQHFGPGQAQAATPTPAKDRRHHHKEKAKFMHYGENAHGEGGKVHW